jgi:putative transposase
VPDARTGTVRACFEKLFEQHGLPGAVRSDNGSPFACRRAVLGLSRLSAWWLVLGIDLERGRPACPQDNPAHERLHRDIARELQGRPRSDQQAVLEEWREQFNRERPHEALGMRCPAELFTPSERRYLGTPEDIDYGTMDRRKVSSVGSIRWQNQLVRISLALAGWSVGLEPNQTGRWSIWFGRLLIGELDPVSETFIPAGKETQP